MTNWKRFCSSLAITVAAVLPTQQSSACTGITLIAQDSAIIFARTQEWGTFDLNSRLGIVPRGYAIQTKLPDGKNGLSWTGKYGLVGVDALNKDLFIDGMNEKGLTANLFYHEGFAEYAPYNPSNASTSVPILALAPYLLMNCATTDEAKKALEQIQVVGIEEAAIGGVPPLHLMMQDPSGKAIVVEFTNGKTKVYDAPLGVITNGPNYDWQVCNLLNYVNLDVPLPHRKAENIKTMKFGAGSRLYGLPGDLTSPSRFLRAAAYVNTARKTPDGKETMYEAFRILDNFNLTVGTAAEGSGEIDQAGMRSSTIWTTAYDTKNRIMQYHTMHNRRVRQIDLNNIDFNGKEITHIPLDIEKSEDIDYIVIPSAKAMPGGWQTSSIDKTTKDAVAFVLSRMNTAQKLDRIIQVKKQVVNGTNYDITFELDNNSIWNTHVYRDLAGQFTIKKTTKVS